MSNNNHVTKSDLISKRSKCPLCGNKQLRSKSVKLQEAPEVSMYICNNCGGASASDFPSNDFLKKLYHPSSYSSSLTEDSNLSKKCAKVIYNKIETSYTWLKTYTFTKKQYYYIYIIQ